MSAVRQEPNEVVWEVSADKTRMDASLASSIRQGEAAHRMSHPDLGRRVDADGDIQRDLSSAA
jgi:hypothetical protein